MSNPRKLKIAFIAFLYGSLASAGITPTRAQEGAADGKKPLIVMVAGTKSHGYGAHEFNAGCLLMQKLLREKMPEVETKVYLNGWPKDPKPFEGAKAIVLFMDGGGGHPVLQRLDELGPLMDKGVGLMCMHYAVEIPVGPGAEAFKKWIGGYYESGYSINPHWVAEAILNSRHPITNGVKEFALMDEWYYNMRFREDMEGVVSVLEAIPDDEARSGSTASPGGPKKHIVEAKGRKETLLWATERPDGGRGVGFTGAHFHWNFRDPNYRRLVLNAVIWTAGLKVPEGGVPDTEVTLADLEANQDFEKPANFQLPKQTANLAATPVEQAERGGQAGGRGRGNRPLFRSDVVSGKTPGHAVDIEVDLDGAKKLFLVIDDAGNGFSCDWADWAEPRIVVNGEEKRLTEMKWVSAVTQWGKVAAGKNAGGGPLQVDGKPLSDGIGAHAASVIEFDLPDNTSKFLARGAVDDGGVNQPGGGDTSVRFLVFNRRPNIDRLMRGNPGEARTAPAGGLPAAESLASLAVADGLEASVFAAEPLLLSPSNIDVDSKGRVWVAEIVNYRGHNGERPEGDRILILEDTDGDGSADKSKVFYQGTDIDSPHGVCVFGDKVIVSAKGKVFVFTDSDGDDQPDSREILFEGIQGEQHDHGIHAFVFGPDGKLYFNFGNAGQQLQDKDGKLVVDAAGNEVIANRKPYQEGMIFRCNLDGSDLETVAWNFRNNWEVCVDSFGSIWQSDNDDDGNQGVRINYVVEFGNYGYKDEMTGAGWGEKRTGMSEDRAMRHWHQNDPGVVPNLLHTGAGSPTGILVYEGNLLPQVFRNQMLHCDAGPNVVRSYPVEKSGAGYSAETVDILNGSNGDRWFRPSDVTVAPDGSLLIADWYDPGVGGHGMGDMGRGRVFRVAPKGSKWSVPTYDLGSAAGAAEALKSPNTSIRADAWLALRQMGDSAVEALQSLWKGDNPQHRARALWLLGKIEGKGPQYVDEALADKDPDIRITGIRLARQLGLDPLTVVTLLASDPAPDVRRECAIALRHCDRAKSSAALWAELASQHDGKDRWYLEALGIGADGNWDACLSAWLEKAGDQWDTPAGRDIIWRSRAKKTPELLAKIVTGGSIGEAEKPRFMRAFDFLSGPEKDAALQSILLQ